MASDNFWFFGGSSSPCRILERAILVIHSKEHEDESYFSAFNDRSTADLLFTAAH